MIFDRRILATVALSVAAHVAFARAMRRLPRRPDVPAARVVSIRVVAPPPPPEPPPEPAPAPTAPAPTPVPAERARSRRALPPTAAVTPTKNEPPPEQPAAPPSATPGAPVFGVSMESTSAVGGGPVMPVGSPGAPRGPRAGGGDGPSDGGKTNGEGAAPVPAYEVTRMPLPQRRCSGKYTDEAARAGVEGTVILDVVVGADGRVREVHVVKGLGHGLDEAAVAAMKACPFSPGRRGAEAVPVRLREFKVTFFQTGA